MSDPDTRIVDFWRAYVESAHVNMNDFDVCSFGDSPEIADRLAGLVESGIKRATTSLYRQYIDAAETLPRVGDLSIVVDGDDTPRCIIRVVQVEIKEMRNVDAQFAWDEGEGDRSLAYWQSAHKAFFARQALRAGFDVDDDAEVVLERFEVIWPPQLAD